MAAQALKNEDVVSAKGNEAKGNMTNSTKLTQLEARIAALPRCRLSHFPTPIEHCRQLSSHLGGPEIFMKRDDLTSLAFGGNKCRHIEFIFSDIMGNGYDTLVLGAYTQSNWCRQVVAAAKRLGMSVSLVLIPGEKGTRLQGNLLLDRMMGAEVSIVDIDSIEDLTPKLHERADELTAQGGNPFVIEPFSRSTLTLGAVAYVDAAAEIHRQLAGLGVSADYLYMSGANMTPAGLNLGFRAIGNAVKVISVSPIEWRQDRAAAITELANEVAELLELPERFRPGEIISYDNYIGDGYGVLSDADRNALKLVASTEGIILDPVYTCGAMAALIDDVESGKLTKEDVVVFLHSGGTPALFAYAEDLELD